MAEGADVSERPRQMVRNDVYSRSLRCFDTLSRNRYSASFAARFSRFLYSLCTPSTRIAFLSCPTAYIGFQHENPLPDAWLWEYDTRFKLVAGDKFVHYNLEEPEQYPEELRGTVDIAIADPPFLNEVSPGSLFSLGAQVLTRRRNLISGDEPLLCDHPALAPQAERQAHPPHLDLGLVHTAASLQRVAHRSSPPHHDGS